MTTAAASSPTGLKETKELLSAIEAILRAVDESLADDGHLTLKDLVRFLPLWGQVNEAVRGISAIPTEFRDLSSEELHALASQGVEVAILMTRILRDWRGV